MTITKRTHEWVQIRPGRYKLVITHTPKPKPEPKEIHITDLQGYAQCRRRWHLSSPLRRHLQPSLTPAPLFIGQGIHVGLDFGYRAAIDACTADETQSMKFSAKAAIQAYLDWMEKRRKLRVKYTGPLWQPEVDEFDKQRELGIMMLKHYALWVRAFDTRFRILGTEQFFKLPIPQTQGKLSYAGRLDGLIQNIRTGDLYVLEFKTTASLKRMSGVYRSLQATAYLWAAQQLYGHLGEIKGVMYRSLRKKIPANPERTKTGKFSRRKNQSTTLEWVKYYLQALARIDPENPTEKLPKQLARQNYQALTEQAGELLAMLNIKDNDFFEQQIITRNDEQIEKTLIVLRELGHEMADPNTLTFPVAGFHCSFCPFRAPCDLMNMGMDEACEALLEAEYAKRDYWEDVTKAPS